VDVVGTFMWASVIEGFVPSRVCLRSVESFEESVVYGVWLFSARYLRLVARIKLPCLTQNYGWDPF